VVGQDVDSTVPEVRGLQEGGSDEFQARCQLLDLPSVHVPSQEESVLAGVQQLAR